MIYLFYGTKTYNIKNEIKKIEKTFDKFNISYYDLTNDDFKNILDDCNTISLFEDKKLVICENATVFTRGNSKDIEFIKLFFYKNRRLKDLEVSKRLGVSKQAVSKRKKRIENKYKIKI